MHLGQRTASRHIQASWQSRKLVRWQANVNPNVDANLGAAWDENGDGNGDINQAPQLPEKMVYKLSYQKLGRPSEGALFSGFSRQFGIVDIVGYHVCSTEPFGSTAHLFTNPRCLKLGKKSPIGSPEYRYLHCTAMGLEGLPLLDISDTKSGIPTPTELLETILHSMIGKCCPASTFVLLHNAPLLGHFNLFLGGVLHRDISSGNILRLQRPIERSSGPSALM